jgi:hypothetical protein
MMLKEALEYLGSLKEATAAPQKLPSHPWMERVFVGGSVATFEAVPLPRKHTASTLADIVALANRFKTGVDLRDPDLCEYQPVVWYDENHVVLVIDDQSHRLHTVTLDLVSSDTFIVVKRLRATKEWYSQPDFVRLLRIELAGTLDNATLLDKARRLKIGQTAETTVGRRDASWGNEIKSLAGQDDDPPDQVTLQLPVYKTPGETDPVYVACTVEVEVAQPKPFRLLPMPDEIERVFGLRMASIAERLKEGLDDGIPCYWGRPVRHETLPKPA